MKSKSSSRKSSPKKQKSRPSSAETEVAVPAPEPELSKIDGQHLTRSDTNVLDIDLEVANPDDVNRFIPDDASTDIEQEEEGEEKIPLLSASTISQALSNLNTSADGSRQVFLNLTMHGYSITEIAAIQQFPHLQKVDFSYNNIVDLSALGSLKFLVELDVSHNEIENLLDFEPPFNLKEVDYSYNQIKTMRQIGNFSTLTTLKLDHNDISDIAGIGSCTMIKVLSISHNNISTISGLDGLNIRELNLSHNNISKIDGISTLKKLQTIDLSGNNIMSLDGLQGHPLLMSIDLENNVVENISDIDHITNLRVLRKLNLMTNPVMNLEDYRMCILYQVPQITVLDGKRVDVMEKVSALNMFDSPPELQATLDHITHTVYNFLQPKKIYECTLPNIEMPYPMLVLTGPQASCKQELTHRLIQEFPDFFGKGISHTTRRPNANEVDGKDYYFISKEDFHNLVRQGCFIQTYKSGSDFYGLSIDAIENVAKEGLACIVHMELEGVRTLRNTHFEPRFVLVIPFDSNIHRSRMQDRGKYSSDEIQIATTERMQMYITTNQDHPGFFDMTINSDHLEEAYDKLRQLVMDYLGLTDADPLELQQARLSTTAHKDETNTQHTTASGNIRRNWSRPSFAVDSSASNPASSTKRSKILRTPVEEASIKRREDAAKKAIEGIPASAYDSFFPRPMVPMTAPAVLEGSPYTQAVSMYHDPSFVAATLYPTYGPIDKEIIHSDSSSEEDHNSSSGLSGFSSARGFSGRGEMTEEVKQEFEEIEKSLDLSALTDALDSLKGSLSTPPPPRDNKADTLNEKPILPTIATI